MAPRLTDLQEKKIVDDYVELRSINAAAKRNNVSWGTAKAVLDRNKELAKKLEQKKEQNTADILTHMESQRDDVCTFLDLAMEQLKNPEKLAKAQLQQIATTMAIVIDKYTTISGGPAGTIEEDALSKSLRELGKELESDRANPQD